MYTPIDAPMKTKTPNFNTFYYVYRISVDFPQNFVQMCSKKYKSGHFSYREVQHSMKEVPQNRAIFIKREEKFQKKGYAKTFNILFEREKIPLKRVAKNRVLFLERRKSFYNRGESAAKKDHHSWREVKDSTREGSRKEELLL